MTESAHARIGCYDCPSGFIVLGSDRATSEIVGEAKQAGVPYTHISNGEGCASTGLACDNLNLPQEWRRETDCPAAELIDKLAGIATQRSDLKITINQTEV